MRKSFIAILMLSFILVSCKTLKNIRDSVSDLQRLEFKLENVTNFRLAGVNISNIKSEKDLSISQGISLANAYRNKELPATFVLNVAAKNPNDGSGETKRSSATLTSFDWRLLIDDKQTVSGLINDDIVIPGTGNVEIIPLTINLDLYDFFADKGYDRMLELAMAIGGVNGSAARLTLNAKPTVKTDFGNIEYPGRINIVDKQWKN